MLAFGRLPFLYLPSCLCQPLTNVLLGHVRLIAVTPSQLKTMTADQARKICLDYTVTGVETITKLPRSDSTNTTNNPFQFIYCSGANSEQD